MWNSGWESIFKSTDWGQYPPEELIRFVARNFFSRDDRNTIKILEVGCGTGANIWFLCREGFDTYGIDGSRTAVMKCEDKLQREGYTASLTVGDILNLPYEKDMFDAVIDNQCIYSNSMADSKQIFKEVKRVLKKGGLFYSRTFGTRTYGFGLGETLPGEPHTFISHKEGALRKDYGIIRYMDEDEIKSVYGNYFKINSQDYLIRSVQQGKHEILEWIIIASNE